MKRSLKKISTAVILLLIILCNGSCEKDKGILPYISFKTGAGYTSADASIAKNTAFMVGITAAKSEGNDILKTFTASVVYDASTTSITAYSETLTAAQGDNYAKDLVLTTRNQAGIEKWTFTITNKDGLVNSVTLTITVP